MITTYTQQLIQRGEHYGFRYVFAKAGDRIPMHSHPLNGAHTVFVVKGSVCIFEQVPNIKYTLFAGSISESLTEAHEIVAEEDQTIIENMHLFEQDWYSDAEDSVGFDIVTRKVEY